MSSPQHSPKRPSPRQPHTTSFPTISEDSAENQHEPEPPHTPRSRERLTSIARILLSGRGRRGSFTESENIPSAERTNAYVQTVPDPSLERTNVLGLTVGGDPSHKWPQSALSNTPIKNTPSPNTPKRVSFESSRPQEATQTATVPTYNGPQNTQRQTQERSRTRSSSPRRFWPISRSRSHDDAFVPLNPYHFDHDWRYDGFVGTTLLYVSQCFRQFYLLLLFHLPSVYFGRVRAIFEYAELSKPEVKRMIEFGGSSFLRDRDWHPNNVPPSLHRFKESWEDFVDSITKECKTQNVVSALLLSAIMSIFQTDASHQPITRAAALISLISAMWSLVIGCIFILRFRTMRSMRKACQWAEVAEQTTTSITWNVWVFLSMPAVFLCWSLVSFIVSILTFVWTSGTDRPPPPISSTAAIGPRVFVTFAFVLGLVYFWAVIQTFRGYTDSKEVREATRAMIEGRDRRAWSPKPTGRDRPEDDLEKGLGWAGDRGSPRSPGVGSMETNELGRSNPDGVISPTGSMSDRGRAPRQIVAPQTFHDIAVQMTSI